MISTTARTDRLQVPTLRQQPRPYLTGLVLAATFLANLPKASAEPRPVPASATQVGNHGWRPMRVNAATADLTGRYVRIYLGVDLDAKSGDGTRVHWRDRSGTSGTLSAPDWHVQVFEGLITRPV